MDRTVKRPRLSHRAMTPREIAARLLTISRGLKRKATRGEGLSAEETLYIASKLRSYAGRLRPKVDTSLSTRVEIY